MNKDAPLHQSKTVSSQPYIFLNKIYDINSTYDEISRQIRSTVAKQIYFKVKTIEVAVPHLLRSVEIFTPRLGDLTSLPVNRSVSPQYVVSEVWYCT